MKKQLLIVLGAFVFCLPAFSAALAANMLNPVLIPSQLSFGLGAEYDFTFRPLAVETDGRVQFTSHRILADLAFNPTSFFGLKLRAGAGNMLFSNPKFNKISSLDDVAATEDAIDGFGTPFNFIGGGELDFAFMKDPNKFIGLGLNIFGLYQTGSKDDITVSLFEYGAGFNVSFISLGTIVPYVGFDYTGVTGDLKSTQTDRKEYTLDITNDYNSPIGVFAGISIVIGDNARFNLEGRFLNEISGGLAFSYNF